MLKNLFIYLFCFPKSLYFNIKYFPLKIALRLPILISNNVFLDNMGGKIILPKKRSLGMIKIGFKSVGIFDYKKSRSIWSVSGVVVFKGKANIGHGSKISVNDNGKLILGKKFVITAESSIVCSKAVTFGDNVVMSWQCLIMDTDFHKILKEHKQINLDKKIIIESNCWIGCRCLILKGSLLPSGSVLGANSLLTKKINFKNSLVAGNPAKIIKTNIEWHI